MTMFGRVKHVHLVGIGGAGMSGIAEVLLNLDFVVSGSDLRRSETTDRLDVARGARQLRPRRRQHRGRGRRRGLDRRRQGQPGDTGGARAARSRHSQGGDARRTDADEVLGRRRRDAREDDHDVAHLRRAVGRRARPHGRRRREDQDRWAPGRGSARASTWSPRPTRATGRSSSCLRHIAVITTVDEEHLDYYSGLDEIKERVHPLREQRPVLRLLDRLSGPAEHPVDHRRHRAAGHHIRAGEPGGRPGHRHRGVG